MSDVFEFVFVVEFLLVFPVTSFHCSILSRFPRVNQLVNDIVLLAEDVQRMNCFNGHIPSFSHTGVVVGENRSIVRFNRLYFVFKFSHDFF